MELSLKVTICIKIKNFCFVILFIFVTFSDKVNIRFVIFSWRWLKCIFSVQFFYYLKFREILEISRCPIWLKMTSLHRWRHNILRNDVNIDDVIIDDVIIYIAQIEVGHWKNGPDIWVIILGWVIIDDSSWWVIEWLLTCEKVQKWA